MSIEAMNAVYQMTAGSPSKKAVLVALANMADQNGACFPSLQYISDRTELSRRTVQNCIKQLTDQKILQAEQRFSKTGQRSNRYVIDLSGVQQLHGGGANAAVGGAAVAPITIINSINMFIGESGAEAEFADWKTVLKKKKAAMTDNAWKRRLTILKKLQAEGHPPKDVLAQSADSGWTGLFALRNRDGNQQSKFASNVRTTKTEQLQQQADDAVRDYHRSREAGSHGPIVEGDVS